jgi:hypothetical protein
MSSFQSNFVLRFTLKLVGLIPFQISVKPVLTVSSNDLCAFCEIRGYYGEEDSRSSGLRHRVVLWWDLAASIFRVKLGRKFLRNGAILPQLYTASQPRRHGFMSVYQKRLILQEMCA